MISFAGIGSRQITPQERNRILLIASKLCKKFVLYSGNAEGADITFQEGSNGNCVIYLPWKSFNQNMYDRNKSLACYDVGKTQIGAKYAAKFHPAYSSLTNGGKLLMCRNTHQILGYEEYPQVSFVVYCANEMGNVVQGGTSQAVRIARSLGIPTFNIRRNETEKLSNYLKETYATN